MLATKPPSTAIIAGFQRRATFAFSVDLSLLFLASMYVITLVVTRFKLSTYGILSRSPAAFSLAGLQSGVAVAPGICV
jgi:hypothetical protein